MPTWRRIGERVSPSTPKRVIRLIRPTTLDGVGVFSVRVGIKTTFYTLHEIRCDIGGRNGRLHRPDMAAKTLVDPSHNAAA